MTSLPKRVIVIGMDGAIPQWCDRMMSEDRLPNLARLAERGSFFYALCPYPTVTASNWTTLATGAWPGRHKVTHYHVHHPGTPLWQLRTGFNTAECSVEHLWKAAEKVGKRSVLIKYETSWPPNLQDGVVIHGCGPNYDDEFHRLSHGFYLVDSPAPGATVVNLRKVGDKLSGKFAIMTDQKEEKHYTLTIESVTDKQVAVLSNPQGELGRVAEGEWSGMICDQFQYQGELAEAFFRLRAITLPKEEGGQLRLASTMIFPKRGWTYPDSLGPELLDKVGPYLARPFWEQRAVGWVDDEQYLEALDLQHDWLGKTAQYLLKKERWDLCYIQTHAHDYSHHLYMQAADPPGVGVISPEQYQQAKRCMDYTYESADRMLGQVLEVIDQDTLVIVVSDHGAVTWTKDVNVDHILQENGLQTVLKDPNTGELSIDWSATRAVSQRGSYIYINLNGRDPDGIVDPNDYFKVREEIINALYAYQEDGVRPFSVVLRREDARMLGLYGDRVGDVVYALREGFGHEHGSQLPTGRLQNGSLESLLVMAGPGIKQGYKDTESMVNIIDVVPTICYLLDIPFPLGCQGALIYNAFEDPGLKVSEKTKLETDLKKWQKAYEKISHITHQAKQY